jgi:hypothetical protein
MANRINVLAASLGVIGLAVQAAHADPMVVSRDTTSILDTGSSSFGGATDQYDNTINLNTSSGTYNATLSIDTLATGIAVAGFGGTTVTPTSIPSGTTSAPLTASSPGGAGQGFTYDYQTTAGTAPGNGQSQFSTGISGGHYTLTFDDGGTGFVVNGDTFTSSVELTGNWSSPASHSAVTYAGGYTLTQDFVYSGGDTFVTVQTTNYEGVDPSIDFTLIGASVPVPEPPSIALLGVGLAGLGLGLRRNLRGSPPRIPAFNG